MKNTVKTFAEAKRKGEKLTMLTAYDYSTAKLVDAAGINSILVGDSLGNVMLGYGDTTKVTMEDMIHHAAAVARGTTNALLVVDMPFMSYQVDAQEAARNAGRLVKEGGAHAVKLEGGSEVCDAVRAIVRCGIPVMAHIGLTPQSVHAMGGWRAQGRDFESGVKLVRDALALQEAGAFAVTIECVPDKLATLITQKLDIPTIGIGAGNGCDGQVLVYADMLAMFSDYRAKFVKHFANLQESMTQAFKAYDDEVKAGTYPAPEHTYAIDDEVMAAIEAEL